MESEAPHANPSPAWLLIDCAHQGEVRLALKTSGTQRTLGEVSRYDSNIPTFTDVLLRFERERGVRLRDLDPVIAIAGVPGGNSTIMERSRWVISRTGLASLFGREVAIINEVAAQAWALRGSLDGVTPIVGHGLPDLTRAGRYVFITYEEGVGTAILDIDAHGCCTVLGAEGGQVDFLPTDDAEAEFGRSVAGHRGIPPSWEQVLMARRDAANRSTTSDTICARLLGRFASNLIYASGAWNGAFFTGRLLPRHPTVGEDFARGLTYQRPYHRVLANAGCWRVAQNQPVLNGCAAMMAARDDIATAAARPAA